MSRFVEKRWKRQNLTLGDLRWPDLWPDLKNDRTSFVMIFGALSNAAYRMSLHGPGAELEGGGSNTPTARRAAARCGLKSWRNPVLSRLKVFHPYRFWPKQCACAITLHDWVIMRVEIRILVLGSFVLGWWTTLALHQTCRRVMEMVRRRSLACHCGFLPLATHYP